MIKASNLTRYYGRNCAVNHIDFTIEKGEIIGFLGPNGAGKSTVMNMLTGYLSPTEGTVEIGGQLLSKNPLEVKKRIGYLPELPPLYPEMTVTEQLRFSAELKKVQKKDTGDELDRVTTLAGISHVAGRRIGNLSKGYRQRVGLAQALLGSPDLLILDEPTVGLDPKQIIEMRNLIRSLGEKHTILLSSHILPEVSAVCSRLLILNNGNLVASDRPEELMNRLSGTSLLNLQIRGGRKNILKVLEGLEGLGESQCREKETGICDLIIQTEKSRDIREELFYLLADNRLPILQMRTGETSLEEIFLNLTTSEKEN